MGVVIEDRRHQFIANLPSEACSIFTPGLAWLLAGLRTCRRAIRKNGVSTDPSSRLRRKPVVFGCSFPAYRCGAVPDSHRIPFNVPWERHQQAPHNIRRRMSPVNLNVVVLHSEVPTICVFMEHLGRLRCRNLCIRLRTARRL